MGGSEQQQSCYWFAIEGFYRITANKASLWDVIANSERDSRGAPPVEQGLEKLEKYLLNSVTSGSKCCSEGRWERCVYFSVINE